MKENINSAISCRDCKYYEPTGRRGGECQRLNVHVDGEWSACSVSAPAFADTWEMISDIVSDVYIGVSNFACDPIPAMLPLNLLLTNIANSTESTKLGSGDPTENRQSTESNQSDATCPS